MRKYKMLYAIMMLAAFVLLIESEKMIFACFMIFLVLFSALSYICLVVSSRTVTVMLDTAASCIYGSELEIKIGVRNNILRFMTGSMLVELEIVNHMVGSTETVGIRVPPKLKNFDHTEMIKPRCCGNIRISCKGVRVQDIFGIIQKSTAIPADVGSVVYPVPLTINFINTLLSNSTQDGDTLNHDKKGNDRSEIIDLREYIPGDAVRSIHWKLSSKTDNLYVKEFGESVSHSTLVFMDLNTSFASYREISSAVAMTAALSVSMYNQGYYHNLSIPAAGGIYGRDIYDREDMDTVRDSALGIAVPEEKGAGLDLLLAGAMERRFARIIYITAGEVRSDLKRLNSECALTAVVVSEKNTGFSCSETEDFMLIEFPVEYEKNQSFTLTI